MLPEGKTSVDKGTDAPRWLDVLPCTGILTAALSKARRGYQFDVLERTPEVSRWCADRAFPKGQAYLWPDEAPDAGNYDVITCFYRLEGLSAAERQALLAAMSTWLKPGGKLLIGFVSARSFHATTEAMRAKRGGPGGVEYVLSPDPNIGPFEAIDPGTVDEEARAAGWKVLDSLGLQPAPEPDELDFRTRNFSPAKAKAVRLASRLMGLGRSGRGRGRFQFRLLGL